VLGRFPRRTSRPGAAPNTAIPAACSAAQVRMVPRPCALIRRRDLSPRGFPTGDLPAPPGPPPGTPRGSAATRCGRGGGGRGGPGGRRAPRPASRMQFEQLAVAGGIFGEGRRLHEAATKCFSASMSIPAKRMPCPLSDGECRELRSRCPRSRLSMRGRGLRRWIPFEQGTPGEGFNLTAEDFRRATTTLSRNPSAPFYAGGLA